jgi:hypothetical protein
MESKTETFTDSRKFDARWRELEEPGRRLVVYSEWDGKQGRITWSEVPNG